MSSKAAVALTDGSWLVNAMPKYTVDDMLTVVVPTVVQLTPSADHWPVNVLPLRISRTQPGAEPGMMLTLALVPPMAARYCIATPLPGVTTRSTCLDCAAST